MKSKFFKLNTSDLLKGLLVAVITALLTGLYQIIQAGSDLTWVALKPVLLASIGAGLSYLIKNLFTNSDGQLIKNEKGISQGRASRILILGIIFSGIGLGAQAQSFLSPLPRGESVQKTNPWSGFFKPVTNDIFAKNLYSAAAVPSVWIFRPTVEISAMQFIPSAEEGKVFDVSSFQSVGMGISYQHFTVVNDLPYNNYGFNFLILFDAIPRETTALNISAAVSVNALQLLNFGIGYNAGLKKPFLLTGLVYNFN